MVASTPAYAEMERRAKALQVANGSLTFAEAFVQVNKADPALYRRHRDESERGLESPTPAPARPALDPGRFVTEIINEEAAALRAVRPTLTAAQAFIEVVKDKPHLYTAYLEVRAEAEREAKRLARAGTPKTFTASDATASTPPIGQTGKPAGRMELHPIKGVDTIIQLKRSGKR